MKKNFSLSVLISAMSLAMVSIAAQAEGITLKDAVQQAVLKNPDVLTRWHSFKAATENIDAVKGGYKPTVDLTAGISREHQDTPITRTPGSSYQQDYTQSSASLVLDQILFDGGFTRNQVEKFNYAQRVRYDELLDASETSALEAVRAYNDVLRYRKLHDLAVENYVHHRRVFEQIQQRVKSGVGRLVDLEQAGGRLALAESNLLTEDSNLHDVSARYQRIVGTLPPEQMADVPELSAGIPAGSVNALRMAYAQNPALAAAQENIVAAEKDAKIRHAKFLPRVDLRAKQDVGNDLGGLSGHSNTTSIGIYLNYNLYNGGADKATERQYWQQVNVAKDERDKTCRDVRQTLYIAYNDVARLKQQLNYLEQHMLSEEKALDAYYKQFNIGQRTLLDLLDSENEAFQSKRAYQNGYSDYMLAMGRTHAAMGDLVNTLKVDQLDGSGLVDAKEKAEFDPNTICPLEEAALITEDKDALYAASKPVIADQVTASKPVIGDQDGDGVLDDKDLCPNTPKNTKVDEHGCPLKAVIDLKGVHFELASYKLTADSFPILDEQVQTLKRYPEIKAEVAGHTDNHNISHDPHLNDKLSENRAKAVMDYLVAHGVAADRLTAKGYAATQPIATNATKAGRAKNRRVELRILNNK
jgi:adhesin transport system outer membrane protein